MNRAARRESFEGAPSRSLRDVRRLERLLRREGIVQPRVDIDDGVLSLYGTAESWQRRVAAGHRAARRARALDLRGTVNEIRVPGIEEGEMSRPERRDAGLEGTDYDVAVIGAGVIGCAVARELSRYDLRILVLEKEEDVGVHTSSRNDGMIHPGFAPTPGSLRARYNVRGNRLYSRAAEELGFTLRRPGSLLLFHTPLLRLLVPLFKRRCRANGVEGRYRYLSRREVRQREPQVTKKQYGGFFMPSAGVVNPFEVTIAYAEHAAQNGVAFSFSTVLEGCELRIEEGERESGLKEVVALQTNRGTVRVGALINAAGNWADAVAELAGDRFFSLHGRRGVDLILDRRLAASQRHILGMPSLLKGKNDHSKGGGLVPCIEGNLLAGPTASETAAREDYRTTHQEVRELERHIALNRAAAAKDVITYFAGVRPATWEEDFIIRRSRRVRNLIHLAGIQSPGLASAPAIAEEAVRLTREIFSGVRELKEDPAYSPYRQPRLRPALLSREQRRSLIHRSPEYGRIVCRCEEISEGEIRDALASPLEPKSVDAVKRRCRAGAGRCHGGFCLPRIMEVIADVRGVPLTRVSKKGGGSWIVAEETKQHAPVMGGGFPDARRSRGGSGGGEAGR